MSETDEILRKVRTDRTKAIRFDDTVDGEPITWYAAYRGKYGWSACRGNGDWMDEPSDDAVEWACGECEHVELVDVSETPEAVDL